MSLTSDQISELQSQLRSERVRILGNIEALKSEFGVSLSDDSAEHGLETHIGDQGTNTFLRERDLAIEEHEEILLDEIDAALKRIETDSYGTCEISGEPISFERLQALPWARTTLEHATT